MILYLEMNETNLPEHTDIGVSIRIRVADEAEAKAKATALAEYFTGLTYEAQLHEHYSDRPCQTRPLVL